MHAGPHLLLFITMTMKYGINNITDIIFVNNVSSQNFQMTSCPGDLISANCAAIMTTSSVSF